MEDKKLGVKTIGDIIALFGSCDDPTKLLLEEVCQFQHRAEPIRREWPVNSGTVDALATAVLHRSSERAVKSLKLGEFHDIAEMWDKTALEIVTKIRKLTFA